MSTFHPFPRLPSELRVYIWSLAVFPGIVHVRVEEDCCRWDVVCAVTPTPSPPVMQVCHESRQHGRYQKAFTTGTKPRYIWINFEVDMISLEYYQISRLLVPHQRQVQRLRLEICTDRTYDLFYDFGSKMLEAFPIINELHMVIDEGALVWSSVFDDYCLGSCPRDNVRFIDKTSGLVLTGYQLSLADNWCNFHSLAPERVVDLDTIDEQVEWDRNNPHLKLYEMHDIE